MNPLRQFIGPSTAALMAVLLFALQAGALARFSPALAAPLGILYVDQQSGSDGNDCLAPATACATIAAAVAKAGHDDTIEIAAGVYNESQIAIDKRLTLIGADAATTIVDGGKNGRVFNIDADATLRHLTIQNGQAPNDPNIFVSGGGGVRVSEVALLLQHVVIRDSAAANSGGAIFNTGQLTIDQSSIISNTAGGWGGGLFHYGASSGQITITHSLIADNVATGIYAGGLFTNRPVLIRNSIIRNNSAAGVGGGLAIGEGAVLEQTTITGNRAAEGAGIIVELGGVVLRNTTVSGNVASSNFGGVYAAGATAIVTATNSTIADNLNLSGATGYNGLAMFSGATAYLANTIVANNGQRQCAVGNLVSLGHNLSSDGFCNLTQAGDQQSADPLLMPLGDYGGPTPTHALRPGSPAIDGGSNVFCLTTDQRGSSRPYDGDNNGVAICDIGAIEAPHQLTIADVNVLEGTGGSASAVFTVTLSPASDQTVTVNYATANGTATAPADFSATSGALTFAPGQTSRTITVPIVPDADNEPDETFLMRLSNPANAAILIGVATGLILNEDGLPTLNITDVNILESNGGVTPAVFTVTLSVASARVVTVNYVTEDGAATSPDDYAFTIGALSFAAGEVSKPIIVQVNGDNFDEGASEQFNVNLADPTNATLGKATGAGVIVDDDTAQLALRGDPQVVEGDSGATPAVFTVTLSTPAAFVVTVDYAVVSGFGESGATANVDFAGTLAGALSFQPGVTVKNFNVNVIGDTTPEPDEEFRAEISNANAPILFTTAFATIFNDDGEVPIGGQERTLHLPIVTRR